MCPSRYSARRPSRSSPDASPWEKGGSVQASTTHSQWPISFFPVTLAPQQCAVCLNTQGCPIAPLRKVARSPQQQQTIPLGSDEGGQQCSDSEQEAGTGARLGLGEKRSSRIGSVRKRERVERRGVGDRRCASCASREAGLSSPLFWQLSRAHARV